MADIGLPALAVGSPSMWDGCGRAAVPPGQAVFLDIPSSMLVRDLAAVSSDLWLREPGGYTLSAPKGSRAVVEGPDADQVIRALRTGGPKLLQLFAVALELWVSDTGGRRPGTPSVRPLRSFAPGLSAVAGAVPAREREAVREILRALSQVRFQAGPSRSGPPNGAPGAPIILHAPIDRGSTVCFSPGPGWVRELGGAMHRVALLPRAFLDLHPRNDRYKILLSWYLAIMLRVNRKNGFHYRVNLRTLLEGSGIRIPDRNVGRFLAAVYRALGDIPGVGCRGPAFALYDPGYLLASKFDFWVRPELLAAYAVGRVRRP